MEKNLHIADIQLRNFRIYNSLEIQFCDGINGFAGNNGAGKTNLLDAIYYTCMSKSYFHHSDQFNIRHNEDFMRITSSVNCNHNTYKIDYKIIKGMKKELFINDAKEEKLAAYVGKFPCVIITPDDNSIILQGSEERRRLMDVTICQLDNLYTETLMAYNRCLQQRNAMLKNFAVSSNIQYDFLEVIDAQMSYYAQLIWQSRKSFMEEYTTLVKNLYQQISGQKEEINLVYETALEYKEMKQLLFENRNKDLYQQRTTRGIHTDDIDFQMSGHSVKKTGSQGQQKSFLFALKMAQYFLLKNRKNLSPILLLDDIFDKFDERRVEAVFQLISLQDLAQVFISDTHPERLQSFMRQTGVNSQIFKIDKGNAFLL